MVEERQDTKEYALSEVATHNSRESCWLAIHGKVYDVTPFLEDHPGGDDIVLENAGRDATEEFEDIGHSAAAREQLAKFRIGLCPERDPEIEAKKQEQIKFAPVNRNGGGVTLIRMLLPFVLVGIAILYSYLKAPSPTEKA